MTSHSHGGHNHVHGPKDFGFAFAIGSLLNVGLVVAQFVYGIRAHSLALIADAGHNLGDALGLLLAWVAYIVARWEPTERYTYGFRSASILAALANATIHGYSARIEEATGTHRPMLDLTKTIKAA